MTVGMLIDKLALLPPGTLIANFAGEIVEIGDDDDGQARVVIHSSTEDLKGTAAPIYRRMRFCVIDPCLDSL